MWHLALASTIVVSLCYLGIAWLVGMGLYRSGTWRENPLAVVTGLIFLSCGIGHGMHAAHLLTPPARHARRHASRSTSTSS